MAFKKTTLKIGICNYHDWPWDIGSVGRLYWHFLPYFLLFGWDFELPTSIQHDVMIVVSFDYHVVWV